MQIEFIQDYEMKQFQSLYVNFKFEWVGFLFDRIFFNLVMHD